MFFMQRKSLLTRGLMAFAFIGVALAMAGCATTSHLAQRTRPVGRPHYYNQQTVCQKYYTRNDPNNIMGSLLGGALGGLVGNQFGDGLGNSMATAAGSAGGALAGRAIQQRANRGHYRTRCHAVSRRQHHRSARRQRQKAQRQRHSAQRQRRHYRHHYRQHRHRRYRNRQESNTRS